MLGFLKNNALFLIVGVVAGAAYWYYKNVYIIQKPSEGPTLKNLVALYNQEKEGDNVLESIRMLSSNPVVSKSVGEFGRYIESVCRTFKIKFNESGTVITAEPDEPVHVIEPKKDTEPAPPAPPKPAEPKPAEPVSKPAEPPSKPAKPTLSINLDESTSS